MIASNSTSSLALSIPHSFEVATDTRLVVKGSHDFSIGDVIEAVVTEEPDEYGSWTVELVKKKSKATLVQQFQNGAVTLLDLQGERTRVEVDLDAISQKAQKVVQDLLEKASTSHYCAESKRTTAGLLFSLTFEGRASKGTELFQTITKALV